MIKFECECRCDLTDEQIQFILECWATFVMCELGMELEDMIMIQTEC